MLPFLEEPPEHGRSQPAAGVMPGVAMVHDSAWFVTSCKL